MLHARRKRIQELAEAEAQGTAFWTTVFEPRARLRLFALIEVMPRTAIERMARVLRFELGTDVYMRTRGDLEAYVTAECPDDLMPSAIEAALIVLADEMRDVHVFEEAINNVLAEERISYELVNGQMVEFESKELHQEVVVPTLRLLSGTPGWDKVEAAYQDALREISEAHAADAITDAGTALQETLTLLGCQGNSLGPLIHSAKKKGLLAAHDVKLADGIEKIADWVSADRSEMGDSHKAGDTATRDDAWLTVHVVGALILRLVGDSRGRSDQ